MKAYKFNHKTKKYKPYELPKGAVLSGSLDGRVACASCGKQGYFGEYSSMFIHNWVGLGFAVCLDCYSKEVKKRFKRLSDRTY